MASRNFGAQSPTIPHLSDGELADLRGDVERGFLAVEAELGAPADLDTAEKGSLVGAINELFAGGAIGSHTDGGASKHDATEIDYERADGDKKNIQAASDTVEAALTDLDDATGLLSALSTTAQGSTVLAINEVDGHADGILASYVHGLGTNALDSATVGTDTDLHDFDKTVTIPAGTLKVGDIIEIEAYVVWPGDMAGAGDCEVKTYVQGAEIDTVNMVGVLQGNWLKLRLRLRLRAADNNGPASVVEVEHDKLLVAAQTRLVERQTGLKIDPNFDAIVGLSAQFSAANAGNTAQLLELTVKGVHLS